MNLKGCGREQLWLIPGGTQEDKTVSGQQAVIAEI
jgi:hypothetical protein